MENNRIGCINRDSNAVNNMIKIVKYFLETGKRLLRFRRDYDLETKQIIKDGNPQKDVGCLPRSHAARQHGKRHNKISSSRVKCHHARKGAIRECISSK